MSNCRLKEAHIFFKKSEKIILPECVGKSSSLGEWTNWSRLEGCRERERINWLEPRYDFAVIWQYRELCDRRDQCEKKESLLTLYLFVQLVVVTTDESSCWRGARTQNKDVFLTPSPILVTLVLMSPSFSNPPGFHQDEVLHGEWSTKNQFSPQNY